MLPTATLRRISFLTIFIPRLIPQSLQFFVGIWTKFLTVPWIMLAVARPSSCMTALPCLNIFSRTILIFFQPPWLTLASRLIPRGTCHLLLRVISPPFARDILLWTRFCLLSVGWPDVRPLVLMALLWSSILSFGLFLVLILFLYSIPVLIPALSPSLSLSTEVSFPCLLRLIQSPLFGGFSVVNMQYKVWALLSQLVRRLASSSTGWSSLVTFWFGSSFRVFPSVVFSRPFSFDPRVLLPFYSSLLLAWQGSMVPLPRLVIRLFSVCPVMECSDSPYISNLFILK